jgi:hypothetical protein
VAHLFGVIGFRGGVRGRMRLLGDTNTQPSHGVLRGSSPVPLSVVAVVSALQTELRERRADSRVLPLTPTVSIFASLAPVALGSKAGSELLKASVLEC